MRIPTFSLVLLVAGTAHADGYVRQPAIDVVHYEIALELSQTDSVSGTARVQIMMNTDGVSSLWLDFSDMTVDSLSVGDRSIPITHAQGHLNVPLDREYGRHEIAVIEVRYHGTPGKSGGLLIRKNKYGRRVFFAENWPDRARYWFPCVDHPSDKATFSLSLTAPENYDVVSNGQLIETRSLLDGRKLTRWNESKPIPTYCMVFGAAEYSIRPDGMAAGTPMFVYSYPQDSGAAERKFARSGLALAYFSELIGPYPYEKLAQVESTTLNGGMENSSAIFYAEEQFQHEPVGESPVPHEIAHQWFGDSITESDWDHLWISEGFATYFEALFYEHLLGSVALSQSMARAAEAIKKFHQTHPFPLIDPGLRDLRKKLNAFNYQKGAWVLHMLRNLLGDDTFFRGIRSFYSLYEGGTATTEDFQRVMEAVSGTSLNSFFRQWFYQPGWPDYRVSWQWGEGNMEITIHQAQTTGLFDMPVEVVIRNGERSVAQTLRISAETQTFRLALPFTPVSVEVDPGGKVLKSVTISGPR
jgi:aminopeptidase N